MSIPKLNYTQIPNVILDNADKFSDQEFKIIMMICRKTFGWQKTQDRISYSQFQKGTGKCFNTIKKSLDRLINHFHLIIQSGNEKTGYDYKMNVSSDDTELCHGMTQAMSRGDTVGKKTMSRGDTTKEKNINKELNKKKADFELPENLNDARFISAWVEWIAYRKEIKKKLTPRSIKLQIKALSSYGISGAIESINQSIQGGWTGLFEPKKKAGANGLNRTGSKVMETANAIEGMFENDK